MIVIFPSKLVKAALGHTSRSGAERTEVALSLMSLKAAGGSQPSSKREVISHRPGLRAVEKSA